MKKILGSFLGVYLWTIALSTYAAEKFDILPDLPEPLAAAQASSVSTTTDTSSVLGTQSIGQEPSLISMLFSLIVVILLIYLTGIIYTKLNRLGLKTMKNQLKDMDDSRVSVISTTPLGNNRTLHVVELDGKRMLIGSSSGSIQLIKDLGSYPPVDIKEGEYSKIEIPNIRIPKIEIPKIEFPNIGFTKIVKKDNIDDTEDNNQETTEDNDSFEISEIYEENADGIIDKLFKSEPTNTNPSEPVKQEDVHTVDPDEYALYKKYL